MNPYHSALLSPLNYFKHSWEVQGNVDTSGNLILTADKLPVLHDTVMNACDSTDGADDGLLLGPRTCTFDPAILQCPNDVNAANCLTEA